MVTTGSRSSGERSGGTRMTLRRRAAIPAIPRPANILMIQTMRTM
jgi:hypothetical protein